MSGSYATSFRVDQSPEEVFKSVTNVRGWWSEDIEGGTGRLGDVFDYHYQDIHRCTIRLVEVVPNERVVWHVLDNHFSFTQDKREWIDTTVRFEISTVGKQTELQFTHVGLVPDYECYEVCHDAWGTYINGSLRSLITTGAGQPNVGEAITAGEGATRGVEASGQAR